MFNMLIHCTTLGSTPHISNIHNSFAVTPETPIEHVWNWTATCAQRNGSVKNLLIACHGLYWKLAGASTGGLGIKLGTGIYKDNIHLTAKLQPWVYNIYLFVCGGSASPENLESDELSMSINPDYVTNNRRICADMAAYTEANVFASSSLQTFSTSRWTGRFDFGAWEGKVEKFSPYGGVTDVTSRMNDFGEEE